MTDIAPISHTNGTHMIAPTASASATGRMEQLQSVNGQAAERIATEPMRSRDRIEISGHAMLLDQLRQMPDVRMDRVEAVREAIASGAYETQERLEVAVDRLMGDILA